MSTPPPKSPHSPSVALSWKRERDELLAALKALLEMDDVSDCDERVAAARALIARIEKP